MSQVIVLTVGSAAGGLARYYVSGMVYRLAGTSFPYGTLTVNLLGCLIIGTISAVAETKFALGSAGRMFLMTGFCGAFTTFSTFIFETGNLIKDGQIAMALSNVLISVAAGFVLYKLGVLLGEMI